MAEFKSVDVRIREAVQESVQEIRRAVLLDAADNLDRAGRAMFRRGVWLGHLGRYWGYRAAADRLRSGQPAGGQ